jgi:hypothetical protein
LIPALAAKEAAAFLEKNRDLFPQRSLPANPTQFAVLAVRIFKLFPSMTVDGRKDASAIPDNKTVLAIMATLVKPDTPMHPASQNGVVGSNALTVSRADLRNSAAL